MKHDKKTPTRPSPFLLTAGLTLIYYSSFCQNDVGIDIANPDASAVLQVQPPANNKGLLIPRLTILQRNSITLARRRAVGMTIILNGGKKGIMTPANVHGQLGEIIAGQKSGRTSDEEIIVFDRTGMALQDVAAAAIVYENAIANGIGLKFNFAN